MVLVWMSLTAFARTGGDRRDAMVFLGGRIGWLMDEAESNEVGEGDGEVGVDKEGSGSEGELGEKRARDHKLGVGSWLASGLRLEISSHSDEPVLCLKAL